MRLLSGVLLFCGIGGFGIAEDPSHRWERTGVLPAAEAMQAAAADERYVYAISSTRVAKYDRRTGERVGLSRGDARHLNSGFLADGHLYCAHSNYPRTPEQSEIKVLDLENMELSTWKDFGAYGGSLTWAVREEGAWWCNFARYGEANDETFLVKFDAEWREQERWIYPSEVLGRLGRYSLSGGLWHKGSLLVTGHDDPVLFELRLPEQGSVLEYVATHAVPFTGQGIAHDPQTGGLVGINRRERQVVFAAAEETSSADTADRSLRLRVLTYNIHHGEGIDGRLDLERIARVIRSAEPDLVALQEVDNRTTRTGQVDQPAELARLTGMHVAFGGNLDYQGGKYGNAVLSRYPIARQRNHLLPRLDEGEQRGVLEVEIELPRGHPRLLLLATHLDHRRGDRERIASAKVIKELIGKAADRPAILAGDLNDVPQSPTLAEFSKLWQNSNKEPLPTIPVREPGRQIDYVLFRPAERWKVIETRVLDEPVASDHRPLLAILELKGADTNPKR